jgi:hypothetical protein
MTVDTKGRMLGVFLLGLLVVCIATNTVSGLIRSLASERWPRASAQVVSSSVYRDGSDVAPRWEPAVLYRYKIGNNTFTSGTIRFLMGPMYQREEASQIAESYSVGSVIRVAYNPANPRESVLQPGTPPGTFRQVLLALFLIGVIGYIYYEVHHPERRILLRTISYEEVDNPAGD